MKNFTNEVIIAAKNEYLKYHEEHELPQQFNIGRNEKGEWRAEFCLDEGSWNDGTLWMSNEMAEEIFKSCDAGLCNIENWSEEFEDGYAEKELAKLYEGYDYRDEEKFYY